MRQFWHEEAFNAIEDIKKAKAINQGIKLPLCLQFPQESWDKVEDGIGLGFDLGASWPLDDGLYLFVKEMFSYLPGKFDENKEAYLQLEMLSRQDGVDPKIMKQIVLLQNLIITQNFL